MQPEDWLSLVLWAHCTTAVYHRSRMQNDAFAHGESRFRIRRRLNRIIHGKPGEKIFLDVLSERCEKARDVVASASDSHDLTLQLGSTLLRTSSSQRQECSQRQESGYLPPTNKHTLSGSFGRPIN